MAPFYVFVCETLKWPVDEALLQRLRCAAIRVWLSHGTSLTLAALLRFVRSLRRTTCRDENAAELLKLDAALADAQENLGQNEVLDAFKAKAMFFGRIGEKVRHRCVPKSFTLWQKSMCMRSKAWLRKRVAAASSPAATCKQDAALTSCATRLRLRQAFSRTLRSQK